MPIKKTKTFPRNKISNKPCFLEMFPIKTFSIKAKKKQSNCCILLALLSVNSYIQFPNKKQPLLPLVGFLGCSGLTLLK